MAVPSYDRSRIQPGYDKAEIESCLESLFDQLAGQYPDRVITWSTWDHENWDRPAKHLCRAFGYSRGKELFNAFGYDVVESVAKETEPEEPAQAEEAHPEPAVPESADAEEPSESDEVPADGGAESEEPEKPDEEPADDGERAEAEKPVQIYTQTNIKRRSRNRVTVGQVLFILLFLATAYGVYWIVNFG